MSTPTRPLAVRGVVPQSQMLNDSVRPNILPSLRLYGQDLGIEAKDSVTRPRPSQNLDYVACLPVTTARQLPKLSTDNNASLVSCNWCSEL